MEYFYLIKATQKSRKADAVIWRTNKSEARALLQLDVDLEDAGIETGRGKDYQKPIRTDFPVFNDLPAEGVLDYSWCERYQLGDDGRTWALKPGQVPADHHIDDAGVTSETVETFGSDEYQDDSSALFNVAELPFRAQLLAQYMAEERHVYHISMPHRQELSALEMDTDNAAVQDLILPPRISLKSKNTICRRSGNSPAPIKKSSRKGNGMSSANVFSLQSCGSPRTRSTAAFSPGNGCR